MWAADEIPGNVATPISTKRHFLSPIQVVRTGSTGGHRVQNLDIHVSRLVVSIGGRWTGTGRRVPPPTITSFIIHLWSPPQNMKRFCSVNESSTSMMLVLLMVASTYEHYEWEESLPLGWPLTPMVDKSTDTVGVDHDGSTSCEDLSRFDISMLSRRVPACVASGREEPSKFQHHRRSWGWES